MVPAQADVQCQIVLDAPVVIDKEPVVILFIDSCGRDVVGTRTRQPEQERSEILPERRGASAGAGRRPADRRAQAGEGVASGRSPKCSCVELVLPAVKPELERMG